MTVELGWGESPLRDGRRGHAPFQERNAPLIAAEWLLEGLNLAERIDLARGMV